MKIKRKTYSILFIIWTIILFTLTSYPTLHTPLDKILNIDKLYHFIAYFMFAFLFAKSQNADLKTIYQRLFLLAIVPPFDELHQIPIPGRDFSFYDMAADFLGFLAVILLLYFLKKSKKSKITDQHH